MHDKYDFLMYERAGVVVLDPVGTFMALLLVVLIGVATANTRLPFALKQLIYAALAMRVVGTIARYVVLFHVYGGSGDSRRYYSRGLEYAESLWRLDPGPLFDPANWWQGKWWGTQFVYFPTSLTTMFTGHSLPGAFLVFSLFAFVGLCGFVVAFHRTYPDVPITRYARWVWLFPALWYWPSSIGKEAIVLLGLGLALMGYTGRNERINWPLLALGTFLVFGIRPEVAGIVIASILAGHWLSMLTGRWTLGNTVQAAALLLIGAAGLYVSMQYAGIDMGGADGVMSYVEDNNARQVGGGSAIDAAPIGLAGLPFAFINIMFRPFPWESRSFMMLISCMEIMAFWAIAWMRRRDLVRSLRSWRHDRLLRVAIPFILLYSLSLGMVMANIAIIARQRIFLFPFLFLLLEAAPRLSRRAVPVPARPNLPPAARAWSTPA